MKKASTRLFFMVSLFIFTVITPLSAGVEPSPFKEVVNKINSVGNNLESINKLYLNRKYIDIAPERVKANAQIIGYAVNKYSATNGCSRPGETETRSIYNSTVIGGTGVEVDEDGFICNFDDWNEGVAVAFAETEDIDEDDWTEDHWKVVYYLRRYYQKFGVAPMIRKLCEETEFPLKKIYDLFPTGPAKGACKVAGLPKPTGCV